MHPNATGHRPILYPKPLCSHTASELFAKLMTLLPSDNNCSLACLLLRSHLPFPVNNFLLQQACVPVPLKSLLNGTAKMLLLPFETSHWCLAVNDWMVIRLSPTMHPKTNIAFIRSLSRPTRGTLKAPIRHRDASSSLRPGERPPARRPSVGCSGAEELGRGGALALKPSAAAARRPSTGRGGPR